MTAHRSYARRLLRASFKDFVRDARWVIAFFAATAIVVAGIQFALERSAFVRGLILGITLTSLVATFLYAFLMVTGSAQTLSGIWGEDLVGEELEKAQRRRHIWGFVNNVELGGRDIDQIVISPRGSIAIEVKYYSSKPRDTWLSSAVDQAVRSARSASSIMRSQHIAAPDLVRVEPVVVACGRRVDLPAGGVVVAGVPVLGLHDLADWLEGWSTGMVAQDNAERALRQLREFRNTRELRPAVPR